MAEQQSEFKGKVLFLGNNDEATDQMVAVFANQVETVNYGLVNDPHFVPENTGYYHTSVVDIPWGELLKVAQSSL